MGGQGNDGVRSKIREGDVGFSRPVRGITS